MKAVTLQGPGKVEVREVPDPRHPEAGMHQGPAHAVGVITAIYSGIQGECNRIAKPSILGQVGGDLERRAARLDLEFPAPRHGVA